MCFFFNFQVLADESESYIKKETEKYCLLFVATGIITGIATFLQVSNFINDLLIINNRTYF